MRKLERALKGEGVEPWELGWAWGCLGLIEVRRGDPEAALQWIVRAEEQPDYDGTPLEQALCLMVKTLALQDLNRGEKAQQAYEQGIELFDADMSSEHDVLIAEILRREAEKRFKE